MESIINKRFADTRILSMVELKQSVSEEKRKELCRIVLDFMFADLESDIKNYELNNNHDLLIEISIKFKDAGLERAKERLDDRCKT